MGSVKGIAHWLIVGRDRTSVVVGIAGRHGTQGVEQGLCLTIEAHVGLIG
jgi:hypothetical protein